MIQRNSFRESTFDLSPEIQQSGREEELGELYKVYSALGFVMLKRPSPGKKYRSSCQKTGQ